MVSRLYCKTCHYPYSTCVCDAVIPLYSPVPIAIIQHPHEARHAKNTCRLLQLGLYNIQVNRAASTFDDKLTELCTIGRPALFFPTAQSVDFDANHQRFMKNRPSHLLFIDATWRKAKKLWHSNPVLHTIPQWHLSPAYSSRYHIRKSSFSSSLSTLEAVSHVLKKGYSVDTSPLLNLFSVMQQRTQRYATNDVQ
ncbi:tRNA-uridine aminocarboxypropyltransferase [Aestuariibacter salexigens]|uniref:tRNA-uridine aminocarboxypropyltransferase n=1 Tax=Aestuariibacter salexigens TaxID=226010 RepID=UPI0009FBDCDE